MNMSQGHPPLILVIDDEAVIRDGCSQTLEKAGYRVVEAENGREGIEKARQLLPDVALIDLKMPGMSGMEIIDILSREARDTVLIMITGYATIVSAVEAIQKGTYDYLPKPFTPDQLRAVIRRALDHRNLIIEARRLREEKERMEKNFVTFVSHEMRSPLVVVRQYIEALKAISGGRLDKDLLEIVERCSSRIQSLETMVEHWLDISRIGEGTFAWKEESLDLREIIRRSAEEMRPLCETKGLMLEADLSDALPDVSGDRESLLRVLTNLIGNAIKYTPEGGKITLAAAVAPNGQATIQVSDTGVGMPADKLPFIFEPFYRVKGKEERQRGSGLGLTYCKRIMALHGGEITVVSSEGRGSTFRLTFGVRRPPGTAAVAAEGDPAAPFRPS
jgi:signal transduction histidine kinase